MTNNFISSDIFQVTYRIILHKKYKNILYKIIYF